LSLDGLGRDKKTKKARAKHATRSCDEGAPRGTPKKLVRTLFHVLLSKKLLFAVLICIFAPTSIS
jgi:hypothetical protein